MTSSNRQDRKREPSQLRPNTVSPELVNLMRIKRDGRAAYFQQNPDETDYREAHWGLITLAGKYSAATAVGEAVRPAIEDVGDKALEQDRRIRDWLQRHPSKGGAA